MPILTISEYAAAVTPTMPREPAWVVQQLHTGEISEPFHENTQFVKVLAHKACIIAFGLFDKTDHPSTIDHGILLNEGEERLFAVHPKYEVIVMSSNFAPTLSGGPVNDLSSLLRVIAKPEEGRIFLARLEALQSQLQSQSEALDSKRAELERFEIYLHTREAALNNESREQKAYASKLEASQSNWELTKQQVLERETNLERDIQTHNKAVDDFKAASEARAMQFNDWEADLNARARAVEFSEQSLARRVAEHAKAELALRKKQDSFRQWAES